MIAVERILLKELQSEQGWLSDIAFYSGDLKFSRLEDLPFSEKGLSRTF